ncbi:V-type proton ATPase subunit D [Glugoides intestinalis]
MTADRLQVISTRMNYKILGQRLKGVQRGFLLLKCKSDALQMRFKEMEKGLNEKNEKAAKLFKCAFKALSQAELYGAELNIFLHLCAKSPPAVQCIFEQVCGTKIVNFQMERKAFDQEILWKCGHLLRDTKHAFDNMLKELIELSAMRSALDALRIQVEATNKRKNALEHKLIPKLECTVSYIEAELDEIEREEFFRLKKIQSMKGKGSSDNN